MTKSPYAPVTYMVPVQDLVPNFQIKVDGALLTVESKITYGNRTGISTTNGFVRAFDNGTMIMVVAYT